MIKTATYFVGSKCDHSSVVNYRFTGGHRFRYQIVANEHSLTQSLAQEAMGLVVVDREVPSRMLSMLLMTDAKDATTNPMANMAL